VSDRKLKKVDIVEEIHEQVNDVNRKQILNLIDIFFIQILKGIREDKIIELRGLGTFEVKLRRARKKVRNPKTGEIFLGKDHGVVIFRPGQELKRIAWPMRG
jgi:integration host factor subunit beta